MQDGITLGFLLVLGLIISWILLPITISNGNRKLSQLISLQKQCNGTLLEIKKALEPPLVIPQPNGDLADISAADAVGRSAFHPNAVKEILKLINEGGLSAAGIGFKVGAKESEVEDECIRLYKGGVISKEDCERVLMRRIDS